MNDRVITPEEPASPTHTGASDPPAFAERRVNKVDRRKPSLRSFLQGALMPRRRNGRRATDVYMPIDWHDPFLMLLTLTMLALSVSDAFLTVTLIARGAYESNALLAWVLNEHPQLFAAVKMGLIGFGIVILVALARSRLLGVISGRALFKLLVAAYFALVGYELWLLSTIP